MSLDRHGCAPSLSAAQLLITASVVLLGLAYLWGIVVPEVLAHVSKSFGPPRHWDLETYFLPKFVFGSQEILRGHLPVWNRFEFGGIPFLATAQPAAVYPPKILVFALFEPDTALRVFVIGHVALLAALFLVFLRDQGIGLVGALAGTLFCSFNVPVLASTGHPSAYSNLALFLLAFLLGDRLGRSPRASTFVALALAVGFLATAGYPQFVMDTGLLLAFHAVIRYATGAWTHPPWRTIPLLAAGFVLGGAVAGVQVLPLAELVFFTGRVGIAAETAAFSPSSFELLAMWSGVVLGVPALLGLAFAGLGRRAVAPLAGVVLCALMFMGGWKLLRFLPGFAAVRLPGTWPLLVQIFLAWLVACGADRLWNTTRGASAGWFGRGAVGVLGVAWAGLCVASAVMAEAWPAGQSRNMLALPAEGPVFLVSVLGAAGGLLLAASALGAWHWRGSCYVAVFAIVISLVGHLSAYPYGRQVGPFGPPEFPYRSAQLIPEDHLREGRVVSLVDTRGGFHLLDRVESPFGREGSLPPPRFTQLEKRLGVVVQVQTMKWEDVVSRRGLLDTLDARYLVGEPFRGRELSKIGYRDSGWGDQRLAVFEAEDPLGRAWGVYGARVVDSPEAALDWLLSPNFDARRQAILEKAPRRSYPESAGLPPSPAKLRRPDPTVVEVEIEMAEPGVLVLADSCFPGWEVTVDGDAAELFCANYLMRGVELDAGRHQVRFEYRPFSVRAGIASSTLALGVIAAVLLREVARRRRRTRYIR